MSYEFSSCELRVRSQEPEIQKVKDETEKR
jgi:hypothetical protein